MLLYDDTIQYNSFIADDKNKREVSADTDATETYYMIGIIKNANILMLAHCGF